MKVLIKHFAIAMGVLLLNGVQGQPTGLPITPKAMDLTDHFGIEPAVSPYGPHPKVMGDLMREGVTGEGTPITPITNFSKEINPAQVTAGDLDNTSYDASKIIKPEIAVPKMDIKATITHEAVVTTPVHLGMQYDTKTTQAMNRVTGQVSKKTVTVEKPIVGMMKNLRQVTTDHQTMVNINTGKIIDIRNKKPEFHGLSPLP